MHSVGILWIVWVHCDSAVTAVMITNRQDFAASHPRSLVQLCSAFLHVTSKWPSHVAAGHQPAASFAWALTHAVQCLQGKTRCLGAFSDPERAAICYDKAAAKVFGPHAFLNFPPVPNSTPALTAAP
jgi:hypothetical protein